MFEELRLYTSLSKSTPDYIISSFGMFSFVKTRLKVVKIKESRYISFENKNGEVNS